MAIFRHDVIAELKDINAALNRDWHDQSARFKNVEEDDLRLIKELRVLRETHQGNPELISSMLKKCMELLDFIENLYEDSKHGHEVEECMEKLRQQLYLLIYDLEKDASQSADEIKAILENWATKYPSKVLAQLHQGDIVDIGPVGLRIDDLSKIMAPFSHGQWMQVKSYFEKTDKFAAFHMPFDGTFGSKGYHNLSHMIELKMGMCTDMSIVVKFLLQEKRVDSYLIVGYAEDFDKTGEPHSFVIAHKNSRWYVVDPGMQVSSGIVRIEGGKIIVGVKNGLGGIVRCHYYL